MIKLAHKGEVESRNHLPLEVTKVASQIATILDDSKQKLPVSVTTPGV